MLTGAVRPAEASRYCQVRPKARICLRPQKLHPSTGFSVSPRPCHSFVPASPMEPATVYCPFRPFGYAFRLCLRSRLALIRLALIRNPWPCGVEVSRLHYRYLCLHLLFQKLQPRSPAAFAAAGMLPYRSITGSRGFGTGLMPDYYPRAAARPVSCYALFE